MSQKTHIVIVVGILLFIFLIYSIIARFQSYKTPEDNNSVVDETIYIQFDKASFGLNCDGRVMDASVAQRLGVESNIKNGYKRFTVQENNALKAVTDHCGKTKLCKISVDESTLGFDPAPRCDKNLLVSYRCFNFDIRREAEAVYNSEVIIDCNSISK